MADSITRNKADLAPVGANADLSDTGVDVNGIVYIRGSFADSWSDTGVAMSQKDGNYFYSVSSLSNGEQFKFKYDGTEYGKSTSENGSGQRNIPTFGSSSSNYNTVEPGSSTFFWTGSKGAVTIWVNSDLTKTWITSGTTQNSFSISYNTPTNGSFSTKPTVGDAGSTVTFVAAPSTGYVIDTVTITDSSTGDPITPSLVSGNTYKFTMPSANVSVNATFKKGTYAITANATGCSVTGFTSPAEYDSTVSFTVTPDTADYALKTLTVKQGTTNITVTDSGSNSYSFTMPAGAVTITATCTTTVGSAEIYFKSATAWVYKPFISVNGGAEQEMTVYSYLNNGAKSSAVKPKSDTGSLRYAWYKVSLSNIDTTKPVTIQIRGNDTYMEATGSFTIGAGDSLYLACDNLMEGSTLVDVSSLSPQAKDFYDTPLHMVATAAEIAQIDG